MGSHGICLRTDEMAGQWVLTVSVCVRMKWLVNGFSRYLSAYG